MCRMELVMKTRTAEMRIGSQSEPRLTIGTPVRGCQMGASISWGTIGADARRRSESGLWRSRGSSLINLPHRLDGVCLVSCFVGAIAFDAGKPEGNAPRILAAALDLVERDFRPQLRPQKDGEPTRGVFEHPQLLRLPLQHLIGHTLERLAQHDEAAAHRIS